ncbi:hypothetical protein ZIOFF_014221 [Zingiber officinale]|uniref:Uncharacterized protein n=1 Tax=Zingiber officinale TaxID=94328 RepID=A0A8J5HDU2_ZINOF|nr:hypothetical protein ZIOFF_014221 [Zingiber officinale]
MCFFSKKSILRDAVTDDLSQSHCTNWFASCMEESSVGNGEIVKLTEIEDMGRTTTVLVRGQFIPVLPAI